VSIPFDKIGKAVAMLSGTSDLEKLAAVGAIERLLKGSGSTFVQLGEAIAGMKTTTGAASMAKQETKRSASTSWKQTAQWCSGYGLGILNDRELAFCDDLAGSRGFRALSPRQEAWLDSIRAKLSMRGAA